ncbi:hypothetical protein D3C74_465210 [compost metagenome]
MNEGNSLVVQQQAHVILHRRLGMDLCLEDDVARVVAQCAARLGGEQFYLQGGCFLGLPGIDPGQAVEVVDLDRVGRGADEGGDPQV